MKIFTVRHGQTDLNVQKRMQGRHGLPLNAVGLAQAEELARELADVRFEAVFSSPQERAVQTARIASRGAEVITDERLEPFDVGSADGQVIDESMRLTVGLIPDITVVFTAYPVTWVLAAVCFVIYLLKVDWLQSADRQLAGLGME